MKLFFSNWKTSAPALLAMLCAGDSLAFHLMPEAWAAKASAFCIFMVSIGLIAAKDADKSNAPRPESSPVTVRPLAVMLLAVLAIGLTACSTQGRQTATRISAGLNTIAVVGCALNDTDVIELTVDEVLATMPPGSTVAEAQKKVSALAAAGDAICVLVEAVQAAKTGAPQP